MEPQNRIGIANLTKMAFEGVDLDPLGPFGRATRILPRRNCLFLPNQVPWVPILLLNSSFRIPILKSPPDSDRAQEFFRNVRSLTARTATRTINLPGTSITFERDALGQAFPATDGLRFPKTIRVKRDAVGAGLRPEVQGSIHEHLGDYPLVIRPVGTHAGVGLSKLNSPQEINSYLKGRDEKEFFLSEFIDYATASDGSFRKYRIIFVDGMVFPCHMAISNQWDVWYCNLFRH